MINDIFNERIDQIGSELILRSDYVEVNTRMKEAEKKLLSIIPEGKRKLFSEYEEIMAEIEAMTEHYQYTKGFQDGFVVSKL